LWCLDAAAAGTGVGVELMGVGGVGVMGVVAGMGAVGEAGWWVGGAWRRGCGGRGGEWQGNRGWMCRVRSRSSDGAVGGVVAPVPAVSVSLALFAVPLPPVSALRPAAPLTLPPSETALSHQPIPVAFHDISPQQQRCDTDVFEQGHTR
jgi:hypothetical protein